MFIAGEALFAALKIKEIILQPYNKWYYYFLIVIISIGVNIITEDIMKREVLGIKAYKIPSGAMIPTLLIGDHIIVDLKHYRNDSPKKGDIIVFKYPEDEKKDFIKRVVGVPEDKIEIKDKEVFINGEKLIENYIVHHDQHIKPKEYEPRDNTGPIIVPPDSLFVMGDNRDQSYDSRYWGYVDKKQIRGKALYIYWSKKTDRIGMTIK